MKTLILTATLAAIALIQTAPVQAAAGQTSVFSIEDMGSTTVDKRKKKRVKGGSGCDDPGDILEHPECA